MAAEGKKKPHPKAGRPGPAAPAIRMATIPAELLSDTVNVELLQRVILDRQVNLRQGTQSAKGRSDVRGGGRKPWRQKGTGRARQGTIRSPLWRGGGMVFPPKPRSFVQSLNKRERQQVFRSVLSLKAAAARVHVVDSMELPDGGTKARARWLEGLKLDGRILLVDVAPTEAVLRSTANLSHLAVMRGDTVSAFEILQADHLVVTPKGLAAMRRSGVDGSA